MAQDNCQKIKLPKLLELLGKLCSDVTKNSDALVAQEVLKTLKGIPIDEVNLGKRGFRTKSAARPYRLEYLEINILSAHLIMSITKYLAENLL